MNSHYMRCTRCWRVFEDREHRFTDEHVKCPHCGSVGHMLSWPSVEAVELLGVCYQQNVYEGDGQRVALVFLCSALEGLLSDVIWDLTACYTHALHLARILEEGYRSVEGKIELYSKLRERRLKDVLQMLGYPDFAKQWKNLREERNNMAHGGSYPKSWTAPVPPIRQVLEEAIPVFAALENDVQDFRDGMEGGPRQSPGKGTPKEATSDER